MKFTLKVIAVISLITCSLVAYVYGQVAIFQVSYSINAKSELVQEQREVFQRLHYDVERLKAPVRLEHKMKELDLKLALPREIHIVRVPEETILQKTSVADIGSQSLFPGRFDLLGRLVRVAQAKMDH